MRMSCYPSMKIMVITEGYNEGIIIVRSIVWQKLLKVAL
jgi:hypothetical protein